MTLTDLKPGPIPVLVKTPDTNKSAQGQGRLTPIPAGARAVKAGGIGLLSLLLLVGPTIFFGPHIVITFPIGSLLAYVAWQIWAVDVKVEQVKVACPGCKKDTVLDGGKAELEMTDQCPECQRALTLFPGREL